MLTSPILILYYGIVFGDVTANPASLLQISEQAFVKPEREYFEYFAAVIFSKFYIKYRACGVNTSQSRLKLPSLFNPDKYPSKTRRRQ